MLSARHLLLLVLCNRLTDASPLVAHYANTTLSGPTAYSSTSSSTTSLAYIQPAAVDSSSMSDPCTISAGTETNLPSRESPSAYGLGGLTAPAPTTPPALTSLDFTFVGEQSSSGSAATHFSYTPVQLSSSVEAASAGSYSTPASINSTPASIDSTPASIDSTSTSIYSTRRYSNVSTITMSRSTMVTLYTTVQPIGYPASQTASGGGVTVTSVTTVYPQRSSSPTLVKPEITASGSVADAYGSASVDLSSSTSGASATSTKTAPHYSSASEEAAATAPQSDMSSTKAEASMTLFTYSPPKEETSLSSASSTTTSSQADTSSTTQPEQSPYAYPTPDSSSSEAITPTQPSATAYALPSIQTSIPPVLISPYAESPAASSTVAQSSTSTVLGGITIVPVNPYSSSSTSGSDSVTAYGGSVSTVTVTVTDAGVTKTITVAKETVTVKAY
ncbi:hypothetical protein DOTSEDRAFT_81009 [Dothistroma septosporum NZE10]|uniref:REJ domain-containing protein n=1 Tax=Dothistroma septosporum (strain NZE10 / CBS 128990) TaxID=675120 RepID=N1PKX5_DOTSN|nr:hypothetical protein DOTSEDRAFT_81009 [Dothistroma septosporum NZE10]